MADGYPSIDQIRAGIARHKRQQAERVAAAVAAEQESKSKPRRPGHRRAQPTEVTRERLRAVARRREAARVAADVEAGPVARFRVARGLTQAEAAIAAGVPLPTWQDAEHGRTPLRPNRQKIARALGVDVAQLWS